MALGGAFARGGEFLTYRLAFLLRKPREHRQTTCSSGRDSVEQLLRDRRMHNVEHHRGERNRELGLDRTLAETFPCSDPLSSIPDPHFEG